jgi:chorismate synthase
MSNTYGSKFRLTTFGESHGPAVGGIIDGCPSNKSICMEDIHADLARRRVGAPRQETDEVEWLSGFKDGRTLGTPIAFLVRNKNVHSEDYDILADCFRPGHADFTYEMKYGIRDHRGGGRASARETVVRVVAGAVAKQMLPGIVFQALVDESVSAIPENDSLGGIVKCRIAGVKAGVGDPLFNKLNAQLAAAMMSIPSAIGFEMGAGFAAAQMRGSEYIDRWSSCHSDKQGITTTNHCGGIQGGISNGMPIEFRVAFHPVVTIPQPVECLHDDGRLESLTIGGRHDRYHIERAAVVVEAMAALCIVNYLL